MNTNQKPIDTFQLLNKTYRNTFNYIISIEHEGCWIGATPEQLFKLNDECFESVSLAGTKTNLNIEWGQKELEEQQIVTDFIHQQLNPICHDIQLNQTETIKAGAVYHLKTSFTAKTDFKNWKSLTKSLHPTPATCGLPQQQAQNHINKIEPHDRKFYTGFLGPFSENKISLFVNLRCMEMSKNSATLFLGGGITSSSIAEDEWQETENKAKTLTEILSK